MTPQQRAILMSVIQELHTVQRELKEIASDQQEYPDPFQEYSDRVSAQITELEKL